MNSVRMLSPLTIYKLVPSNESSISCYRKSTIFFCMSVLYLRFNKFGYSLSSHNRSFFHRQIKWHGLNRLFAETADYCRNLNCFDGNERCLAVFDAFLFLLLSLIIEIRKKIFFAVKKSKILLFIFVSH